VLFGRKIRAEDFEAVALPYVDELFRTAVRVTGDRSASEDIVQDTYLQAWKSFHRFEPGTNCRAWLFKIMFYVIHHHRRKWFNARLLKEGEEFLEDNLAYEPPTPQHISDEEVLEAFEKLPRRYREVVLLADIQELSYKEVAETLSIPIGTVMSRLSRGRKLLRVDLAEFARSYGIKVAGRGEGA
jgi:RNA polymerase sigma-70 factor, ECF subfamily